jgi:enoyl-CoA hydratase/carnithine racemase
MKSGGNLDKKHDFFSATGHEDIVKLKFKEDLLVRASDFKAKDSLFDYLDLVSKSNEVKVVLIIGSPEKKGCEEYTEFYRKVFEFELGEYAIEKLYYAVNELILRIVDLDKMVVHADSGKVISLFMNVSLACDYRIVANNTIFQNPCAEFGLVPKGGGAFFLSKMLGLRKAFQILTSAEDITAQEAMELGLVDKIVPLDELEQTAITTAKHFAQRPASTLLGVKRLLNYSLRDLHNYLELENQVLLGILQSPDCRKKLRECTQI